MIERTRHHQYSFLLSLIQEQESNFIPGFYHNQGNKDEYNFQESLVILTEQNQQKESSCLSCRVCLNNKGWKWYTPSNLLQAVVILRSKTL